MSIPRVTGCFALPADAVTITEFSTGITASSYPVGITAGPDGNLWFTEEVGNKIGRITPAGVVTEFSSGIQFGSDPESITAGPDGNLWFTESYGRIGRVSEIESTDGFARLMRGGSPVSYYSTIQGAYNAAVDGDIIQAVADGLTQTLVFASNISVLLGGGYDATFAINSGMTTLTGNLTISEGTLTVENLTIE